MLFLGITGRIGSMQGKIVPAKLTSGAQSELGGTIAYPAPGDS
jgi:hypothetical protein